jgi:two-component system, OmpR family, sensor histidine kinase CpxA
MPRRFPLYAKILLLFFLNLALLAVMFWMLFLAQFRSGPDWLLPSDASERIEAQSDIILAELGQQPRTNWSETLHRFDSGYHDRVRFLAFDGHGEQLAGQPIDLPDEIRRHLLGPPGPHPGPGPGEGPPPDEELGHPPPDEARENPSPGHQHDPRPKFLNHTKNPSRYWVIVRAMLPGPNQRRPAPLNLVLVSDTLGAGGLFFAIGPWITFGLAAVALSAVLWFPLLRGINRSIAQMTDATRQIAEGRFETRVAEARRDELGDLGRSVNQMAARLAGLVAGQKRFLGDVAHELCSPLAKLRVSLGILDQRAGDEHKDYVARAEDEAAHIAGLVNELLSFSKASLAAPTAPLRPVNVRQAVDKAVHREAPGHAQVNLEVPGELMVRADAELLTRALSNLLRNAVRYAGEAGPITVCAQREEDQVKITVADHGPGVPAGDLPRLFDPFYRADASRDRETGGVGLGLAIVKTCIESCGGAVACRNLEPGGLEVTIRLQEEKPV